VTKKKSGPRLPRSSRRARHAPTPTLNLRLRYTSGRAYRPSANTTVVFVSLCRRVVCNVTTVCRRRRCRDGDVLAVAGRDVLIILCTHTLASMGPQSTAAAATVARLALRQAYIPVILVAVAWAWRWRRVAVAAWRAQYSGLCRLAHPREPLTASPRMSAPSTAHIPHPHSTAQRSSAHLPYYRPANLDLPSTPSPLTHPHMIHKRAPAVRRPRPPPTPSCPPFHPGALERRSYRKPDSVDKATSTAPQLHHRHRCVPHAPALTLRDRGMSIQCDGGPPAAHHALPSCMLRRMRMPLRFAMCRRQQMHSMHTPPIVADSR
jgi:hypothetical protein